MRFTATSVITILSFSFLLSSTHAEVDWLADIHAGKHKTIVTMGTSLTAPSPNWVPQLEAWLKNEAPNPANVSVVDVGVSGASSDNPKPALSGIQTQISAANAAHPDVVFIEYSMNDAYTPFAISPAQASANLDIILNGAASYTPPQGGAPQVNLQGLKSQNPNVKIVLMTMNNCIGVHQTARPNLADYYQGYRDKAQAQNLMLIDHYPKWTSLYGADVSTWNSYVPDGIHPNGLGAARISTPDIRRTLAGKVTFAVGGFESVPMDGSFLAVAHNSGFGVWGVTDSAKAGNAVVVYDAAALAADFPGIHASEGKNLVTLQASNHLGTITQAFDTVVGQKYQVLFDHSILSGGAGNRSAQLLKLRVSATGTPAQEYSLTSDGAVTTSRATWNTLPYVTQTYAFTATETSTMLTITNQTLYQGDKNFGTTIDNVRLTVVP